MDEMLAMRRRRLAVIFDVDGVLIDSYQAHFQSWLDLGKEFGNRMTETAFASTFGRTSREIIREMWGSSLTEEEIAAMNSRKEVLYREIFLRNVPAKPGVVKLIDSLTTAGLVMAIGSSAPPANVKLSIESLGREGSFAAVVTGVDVTRGKPDPQVFLIAAERIGVEPGDCAVIEDSTAGVAAALAAGMHAIAITGTNSSERLRHAHLVIDSLNELTPNRIADLILYQHTNKQTSS
jgi:beta-phosphoglucomutase